MKRHLILLLAIVISSFSCEKKDNGNNYFDFEMEQEFQINQEYRSNNRKLRFSISDINDSRCPTGVYCIWQGMVTITIAIEKPAIDTITLNSHDELVGNSNNYEFELGEVTPYPDITKDIEKEDYVVNLKISKQH